MLKILIVKEHNSKKGVLVSLENILKRQKKKIREARARQGSNVWNKGKTGYKIKPASEERKRKIGEAQKGEKNHNWKGGITPLRTQIYHTLEYKQWLSNILKRDDYTCILCRVRGGQMAGDHYPKAFSEIIKEYNIKSVQEALNCSELWNLDNGRTLCKSCHLRTENYGGRIRKK